MKALCLVFVVGVLVFDSAIDAKSAKKTAKENVVKDGDCGFYRYCSGESFPMRTRVQDFTVSCDEEGVTPESIKDNCCLGQSEHFVCYGARVEGKLLNYSNSSAEFQGSTDFSGLCENLVREQGKTPGKYNSATFLPGGGSIAFIYGQWSYVDESERHINHLACSYVPE